MKIIRISAVWCSSCIVTYKDWNLLKEKFPENDYVEYDYDMDVGIVSSFQVGSTIPVIIAQKNNQEVDRIVGEKNIKQLTEWIEEVSNL